MTCTTLLNKDGEPVGFICTSSWGMGITDYGPEDGEEFRYIYGFSNGGDPHDFDPDFDSNTKEEIEAWEEAKRNCNCGR